VYDTSIIDGEGRFLMVEDGMDPDDACKGIRIYLETGECIGHM
jgi:hypothetical protein